MAENHSHTIFGEFRRLGFDAGMTLKSAWHRQDDVYAFVQNKLVPAGIETVIPDQVHGVDIKLIDSRHALAPFVADGVITRRPDRCLTVTTADCIPLLIADPTTGYFGAIHIGWRGLVSGIIESLFRSISDLEISLDGTLFFLGPGIGPCCFEVGGEVAALFDPAAVRMADGKSFVDLRLAVKNKIMAAGVENGYIVGPAECTSCFSGRYYSYRRDKKSPIQMVSFIYKST